MLIYLRQEGRRIGLLNKLRAYRLQDGGLDTVEANLHLGFDADQRDYAVAIAVLEDLGISAIRLLTNNPAKIAAFDRSSVRVVTRVPIGGELNVQDLLAYDFAFVLFVGFKENEFTRALAGFRPSFCLTDTYPHPDLPDGLFRGVLSHRAGERHRDLLLVGGSYNDGVFYPGFACCKYHFFRMLDNYLWCLRPRGRILTDQRGMDCTVENDPRWQLTFEDLVALERRFPWPWRRSPTRSMRSVAWYDP